MYILLLLSTLFVIIGIIAHKNTLNALTVFNGIWFATFALFNLGLTPFPSELNSNGLKAFLIMLLGFNFSYLYFYIVKIMIPKRKKIIKFDPILRLSKKGISILFIIWLVIIILEGVYSRGFPAFWLLTGIQRNYAHFGIPTVHGLVNSLAWIISLSAFIKYLDNKNENKVFLRMLFFILIVYVLLFARQTIATGVIQLSCVYFLKRKVRLKKVAALILVFVIAFGLIGNFRSGSDHFRMVAGINSDIPDFFLGFHWVYMYMITPVGNVNSLVNITPDYGMGIIALRSLVPSVLMEKIFGSARFLYHDFLVNKAFNVSSFLLIPYLDFGFYGVLMISLLYGFLGVLFWSAFRSNPTSEAQLMKYAVYFQIIITSFFVNMLTMLPIIIQFLYISLLFRSRFFSTNSKI